MNCIEQGFWYYKYNTQINNIFVYCPDTRRFYDYDTNKTMSTPPLYSGQVRLKIRKDSIPLNFKTMSEAYKETEVQYIFIQSFLG